MRNVSNVRFLSTMVLVGLTLACSSQAVMTQGPPTCAADNVNLKIVEGFCAVLVADNVGRARHLTVAPNGDVFVALSGGRGPGGARVDGGVLALRDTDGDGQADVTARFGAGVGDDVEFRGSFLYYSTNDAVMRYPWREGALEPAGPADTIVSGLPAERSHRAKSFAFGPDGSLFVNIGSPSNACQDPPRTPGASGKDPCDELATRAGVWRFWADSLGQRQADGVRYATGLRNTVALAVRDQDGALYGVVHGRDQLSQLWPEHFSEEDGAEKPAEEFVRIVEGSDFGWPYCFYDPAAGRKVLAPEYGGDGTRVGRCAQAANPLIGFPAHWAPNGLHFYRGRQFPAAFRGGAFIAFHGSWNRAPLPQGGYNIVFARFEGDEPPGRYSVFADGFAGRDVSPRGAEHRPVGIAEGPDGSLYVSDDTGGRIYRILYVGR
ncbi:MAG: PQQ-dependent sugar dehydrogenase [Gemmatimonadota bacterium]|nr:PQQ-dependent sugar dehydrogenase [Gemmatimonadota bacterium]